MLSMQLSKRFVQQIVLDGFAFVGILNNLLDCYRKNPFGCQEKLHKQSSFEQRKWHVLNAENPYSARKMLKFDETA